MFRAFFTLHFCFFFFNVPPPTGIYTYGHPLSLPDALPIWLGQRAAIVATGPIANFIFAIVVLAGLFSILGQPFTPAVVGEVVPGSAAEAGGFQPGDEIVAVDGRSVERFEELQIGRAHV